MAGARNGAGAALIPTGLLGGSFNPAHGGHRTISLHAIDALGLDDMWWLVSPGNPLKAGRTDVAPLSARLESARRVARRSRIIATDIESRLGTRYTVDTVAALIRRYPRRRFIWVMGGDIVGEFHRWRDWRRLARLVPIAIIVRPGYEAITGASPAAVWLRRFVRPTTSASEWTRWRTPAIVLLHCRPDSRSATALRRADPDWYRHIPASPDNRAPPMPRLP